MRRAAKRDANHGEIVTTFERLGCTVFETDRVGGGWPDLVVGVLGVSFLVEIKNPETHYGRAGLNGNQSAFARDWRGGPVHVCCSTDEAVALVQNWRSRRRGSQ